MEIKVENFTIAKAQAFIDIQEGIDNKTVVDHFLASIKDETISEENIINAFYAILLEHEGRIELLDYLNELYPNQTQSNDIFKISLSIKENKQPEQLIADYHEKYGQDKNILMLELNYLVSHNFLNPARIREILSQIKEVQNDVV